MRKPSPLIALLLALQLLLPNLIPATALAKEQTPKIPPAPFADVYATKYQDAVGALYALGVAQGTDDHSFSPDAQVTRAQMVAFAFRALGEHVTNSVHTFKDVPADYWAAGLISRGVDLGLVQGDAGRFRPEDSVTYGEAATMLVRATGYEGSLEPGDWPVNYLLTASKIGLMNEVDGSAFKTATRGDIALMIRNAIFKVKRKTDGQTLSQSIFRYAALGKVLPESPFITGNTVQLSFMGIDWYGNSFPLSPNWKLYTNNASVDDKGLLTVTGSGPVTVQGVYGTVMAAQTYTRIKGLTVTPSAVAAKVGSTVTVKVAAAAEDGSEAPVTPTLTVSGPGTLDAQSGTVTVTGTGAITVSATAIGLTGTAVVNGISDVSVSLPQQLVTVGDKVQLTFNGIAGNNSVSLPATWTVVSGPATVDDKGNVTATGGGEVVVQGTYNGLSATGKFKVATGLQITATSTTLSVGDSMQFTANVNDQAVPASWQWPSAIGIGNQSGVFAATNPGAGAITATYGKLTASVNISVAGPAVSVNVTTAKQLLPANGLSTTTLTAKAVDAFGNPARASGTVVFNLSDASLGSLSSFSAPLSNGRAEVAFTAGTQVGNLQISATVAGANLMATGTTLSLVQPMPSGISLNATPDAINADGVSRSTLTATLVDQDGQPLNNNTGASIPVNLTSSNSGIGYFSNSGAIYILPGTSSATQYFTASTVLGTTFITANSSFSIPPLKLATVKVGQASKLVFVGTPSSVVANGTTQMHVQVQIQDSSGYVQTNDNTSVIALSVVSSDNSVGVPAQTVVNGTASFSFATTKSGIYTITARSTSATPALAAVQTTGTFTAGSPASVQLVVDPPVDAVSADGHTPVRLLAKVLDINGNLVTGSSDVITFSQSMKNGAFMPIQTTDVTAVNGVAALSITPTLRPAVDEFTATSAAFGSATLQVRTQVTGGAVKLQVRPVTGPIPAGQPFQVKVYLEDGLGNVVTSDNGRIVGLTLSDPNATVNGAQAAVNGVATFTVTPSQSNNLAITAQSPGLASDTTGQTVQVTQAPADHIILSAALDKIAADGVSVLNITPKPVDAFGNVVNGYYPINFSLTNQTTGQLDRMTAGSFSPVNFRSSNTPGSVTITASSTLPVIPLTISTYTVGAPTKIVVDPPKPVTAGTGQLNQMQITVRLADDKGNTVTSLSSGTGSPAPSIVVLTASGMSTTSGATTTMSVTQNYPLPPGYVYADGVVRGGAAIQNGVATFTFTDTKAETITFTPAMALGSIFLSPVPANGTVNPGTPVNLTLTASSDAAPVSTAVTIQVTAKLADTYGNPVMNDGDTINFSLSDTRYFTVKGATAVPTNNGVATLQLVSVPGTNGNASITATSTKTGLMTATPLVLAVDNPPQAPLAFVSSMYGNTTIGAGDPAIKVYLAITPRSSVQNVTAYLNGMQVTLYTDSTLTTPVGQIQPGANYLTAYIKGTNGLSGNKTFWVNLYNSLGSAPSQPVVFTTR